MKENIQIIRHVRTIIGLFVVALLAAEVALLRLAGQVADADRAFAIAGGILVLIVIIASVVALARPSLMQSDKVKERADEELDIRYDVFIASPMSSLGEESYVDLRSGILRITESLNEHCGYVCYYAGNKRESFQDFETSDIGLNNELRALKESRNFVLIYPEGVASSALVEAGIAIALEKPSIYFKQRGVELPFSLRNAANSTDLRIPKIKIYEYDGIDDLIRVISINNKSLFRI